MQDMSHPFESPPMLSADDIRDPEVQKQRLWNQDPRLLEAANTLANKIRSLPRDPVCPDVEPRALLVGGFVRDALLGLHPKDLDVEVYGVSPVRLEELLEQLYPGKVDLVGRAFGIIKVHLDKDVEFDVSIPRRESKTGLGHTDFEVQGDPSMDMEEAARRRDFTVNALAADPMTGEVIDAFDGVSDLQNRVLRVTDRERFQDDALRVYRAVQFAGRFNFTIDPESFRLMREMGEDGMLDRLSRERITEEIKKLMLKSPKPSVGFELLRELGIIERDYPELHALIGMPQESEWHPEGDVWIHTMMVVDQAAKIVRQTFKNPNDRLSVLMGALCHDLGKPATTKLGEKDGIQRIRSLGHEEAGLAPAGRLLDRWMFGEDIKRACFAITEQHLKPNVWWREVQKGKLTAASYANAIRKLIKKIHPVPWQILLVATEADHRGRGIPGVDTEPYEEGRFFAEIVAKEELDKEPTKPLVRGEDLIARGLKPGKRFGELINGVEAARDRGEVRTREEALTHLDALLQQT